MPESSARDLISVVRETRLDVIKTQFKRVLMVGGTIKLVHLCIFVRILPWRGIPMRIVRHRHLVG